MASLPSDESRLLEEMFVLFNHALYSIYDGKVDLKFSDSSAQIFDRLDSLPERLSRLYIITAQAVLESLSYGNMQDSLGDSPLGVYCFSDIQRTLQLQERLFSCTSHMSFDSSTCVDIGSGTGILGLSAAELGMGHVILIEYQAENVRLIGKVASRLGYRPIKRTFSDYRNNRQSFERESVFGRQILDIYCADALQVDLSSSLKGEKVVDVIICELWDTHLRHEQQIPAIQHIMQHAGPGTIFIPQGDELEVTVYDQFKHRLTDKTKIAYVDFSNPQAGIEIIQSLKVIEDGFASRLLLSDRLIFSDGHIIDGLGLLSPSKLIARPYGNLKVCSGDNLALHCRFSFSDNSFLGYYLF